MSKNDDSCKETDDFELLFREYELYSNIQVQADTVYHNRTSVITLTQGLLFVAYNATNDDRIGLVSVLIPVVGFTVALIWIFFEQRNLVFFDGRNFVLSELEKKLHNASKDCGCTFNGFWREVPKWVNENAKWHQKFSAQKIQRIYIPLVFAAAWIAVAIHGFVNYQTALVNDQTQWSTKNESCVSTQQPSAQYCHYHCSR